MGSALKATLRDIALAAVAAFTGAAVAGYTGDVSYPALKALVITAAYAAVRAGVGVLAAKFAK